MTNIEAALETSNVVQNTNNCETNDGPDNVETEEAKVNQVEKSVGECDLDEIRDSVNQLVTEPKPVRSAVETVFATAVIGETDTSNVTNVQFEHLIQIMIHVNTANLWENARSYIFHHLGRDV